MTNLGTMTADGVVNRATLGHIPGLSRRFSPARTLAMFRQTCTNRWFELEAARVYDTGVMRMPIYLSLGQEHIPAAMAAVSRDWLIFAQHRAHSYYLSFGGDMARLIDELLHRPTGCSGGMGGSASFHCAAIGMYGHSGLIGDQVPIAVGAALASGRPTLAVFGDAAAEEDYLYGAMGFASTKHVPVLFVCEDNDLSILTPVSVRRSWNVVDVARALGIPAEDIADDPWLIAYHVEKALSRLPAFLNIRTCRHRWHAGTGVDGEPAFDRYAWFKDELAKLDLADTAARIEEETRQAVARTWHEALRKPSGP
jgi:pyruvate dehydrogenase E1 component alpha subunit